MDRVIFLGSGGGILTHYPQHSTTHPLGVAPYVEMVSLPVVSVDSAALYGDRPENLATLTYTSGAALTFFCDSEAGGNNTSGAGSFDDPWRSLKTASRFLSCNACVLRKAAPYIQLKVKGTVDYVSQSWQPFGPYGAGNGQNDASHLIVRGWGGKCDLGGAVYAAGYLFDIRGRGFVSSLVAASGCTLVNYWGDSSGLAVDCEFVSGGLMSCIYNCSGAETPNPNNNHVVAEVCRGGSFKTPLDVKYAYAPTVDVSGALWSAGGMIVRSAAVSATVNVSLGITANSMAGTIRATGVDCAGSPYLGGLTVKVTAALNLTHAERAEAGANVFLCSGRATIADGHWSGAALATAVGGSSAAAGAYVFGITSAATVNNVQTVLAPVAAATVTATTGSATAGEGEETVNLGEHCSRYRSRKYVDGVLVSHYESPWSCWSWE